MVILQYKEKREAHPRGLAGGSQSHGSPLRAAPHWGALWLSHAARARARARLPPPPSETVLALSTRIAGAFLAPVQGALDAWPAPLAPEEVGRTLTAILMAEPAAVAHTDWHEVLSALPLAVQQIQAAMDAYLREVMAWCMVLADPASGLDDPSTLVRILEQLTAQRYQYPSAIARVVGQAIQSLEAYLAAHAPSSTTHPARHAVEL